MPAPASQGLAPAAFLALTRTRYAVPLSSPVTSCVTSVPECLASTQPSAGEGDSPVCTASIAVTALSPEDGAEV